MNEHVLEVRGIYRASLAEYFAKQEGVYIEGDVWRGNNWQIKIGKEEQLKIGALKIPMVKLTFYMDEATYETMHSDFMKKFACMGG